MFEVFEGFENDASWDIVISKILSNKFDGVVCASGVTNAISVDNPDERIE
jgi:hypothetical protein